jgi:hypothetical protein
VYRKISPFTHSALLAIAGAATVYLGPSTPAHADTEFPPLPPKAPTAPRQYIGHRHPGSTYVYVLKGVLRLGIDGQPVQVVHAGESFFEPMGALHTVAENASTTEPASAIAVLIVPDGARTLTPVEAPKK